MYLITITFNMFKRPALFKFFTAKMGRLFKGGAYSNVREVGVVVPAKFTAFTKELRISRILQKELNGRAAKYDQFELKIK